MKQYESMDDDIDNDNKTTTADVACCEYANARPLKTAPGRHAVGAACCECADICSLKRKVRGNVAYEGLTARAQKY